MTIANEKTHQVSKEELGGLAADAVHYHLEGIQLRDLVNDFLVLYLIKRYGKSIYWIES